MVRLRQQMIVWLRLVNLVAASVWGVAATRRRGVRRGLVSVISEPELLRMIRDVSGPEAAVPRLSNADLGRLLNALYLHLDTSRPDPLALQWFEVAADESRRRS